MRERLFVITVACLWGALGCSSNLTSADGGPAGSGGGGDPGTGGVVRTGGTETGGTTGTGGSVDAAAGLVCPPLAEPASSPPPSTPAPGCPCTRALGPGNSYQCPMGAGQTASATIGAAGGQIMLLGQQGKASGVPFGITFPPGALASDTLISVTETDLPPPSGVLDFSPVYLVEPRGLKLAKVASLQMPWSSNMTSIPNTLGVYARDEDGTCGFSRLTDSYTNAGFEQASLLELGYLLVALPATGNPAPCGADASARD